MVGVLVLLAVFALAIYLRVYRLDEIPAALYVDETNAALDALAILEGRGGSPFATGWYETPNGYLYYMAAMFRLFGVGVGTLKSVSILPAVLTIPALYLLASRLFGAPAGIYAAALLATSRWHLTMSRWGWNEVMPPLFQIVAVLFLIRGLHRRNLGSMAVSGLVTGFTLYTYLSSRLVIATMGIFVLIGIVATAPLSRRELRLSAAMMGAWLGALLVAAAPLLVTYLSDPFTFLNRTREINIFNEVQAAGSLEPLVDNVLRHIRMFFQVGDPTGRQNLPGLAHLEPITGALFAVGVIYGLLRWRDLRWAALLLWLLVGMSGGFLSERQIDSPNAYRTLTALPAVIMIVSAVLDKLKQSIEGLVRSLAPANAWLARGLAWAACICIVGASGAWDTGIYFGAQAASADVQHSFNQAETRAGEIVAEALERGETVYLTPNIYSYSPLRFLVYSRVRERVEADPLLFPPFHLLRPEVDLPLPTSDSERKKGLLLLLDNRYASVLDYLRQYYPEAVVESVTSAAGRPLFLRVGLPPRALNQIHGLTRTTYIENPESHVRVTSLAVPESSNLPVIWSGGVHLPRSGIYYFEVEGAQLWIDDSLWEARRYLGRGLHALELMREHEQDDRPVVVRWQTPGMVRPEPLPDGNLFTVKPQREGLRGSFYSGENWLGEAVLVQNYPFLISAWPKDEPLPHPFSATFSGYLVVDQPGEYGMHLMADDGVRLWLSDRLVAESVVPDRPNGVDLTVRFAAGQYPIRIDYFQRGGGSALEMYWKPPNAKQLYPIPPSALRPDVQSDTTMDLWP